MISIHKFTFNPFQENTYLLYDESGSCIIVDPGCYDSSEESEVKEFLADHNLKLDLLVNTHAHIDHILGNDFIHREFDLKPILHKEDLPILKTLVNYGEAFGIKVGPSPEPVKYMEDGDEIKFGNSTLKVKHVPGHSPGHVVLISEEQKFIIGGDVLFLGSIGRTDLPLGDHDTLIRNIHDKLMSMDEDYEVHPGHGPSTNIGYEKKNNPFLQLS